MTLNEAYDLIDGKYVKAENNFYHYVSVDKFHNMVKKGVIFSGNYPANTYGYGKNKKSGEELCLVRSDRRPDLVKNLNLSGSVGDIKIFFNEDNLKNDFGKSKNIDEYPIQGLQYMKNNLIPKLKKQIIIPAPKANSLLDDLNKNFYKWDKETTKQKIEMLNKFIKITKEEAKKNLNNDLQIESEGMAVIPTEWKTEILCYEFKGKVDDREFLVYINAENGREEDILIITNTPNGTLTM